MERLILLLVALVVSTNAGPLQKLSIDSCSRTCTGTNKFKYEPGNSYEYVYRANVKTLIQGANTDEAGLIMTATVNLDVLSKCELSMRLSDIKLDELDPNNAPTTDMTRGFAEPLEKNSLRISFQDGGVEHLCLTANEPTWVLNIKRGVVSLLQNKMDDFASNKTVSETDVSGECQTNYAVQGSGWYTTTITKTKDLLGCKDRQGYNSAVQGIPYSSDSTIQSLPILKSNMECSHEVDTQTGLLKKVTCNENHIFRPFSKSESGAVTSNTQELKYLKHTKGIKSTAGIRKEAVSLKFEHHNDASQWSDPAKNLKSKLQEICQQTKSGVQPETPRLFTDLVYIIKSADSSILTKVYGLLKAAKFCPDNAERTRKFFLDALPMAGNSGAVSLMTSLITRKAVTESEADMWITSLSFIKKPTQEMLREVKPLINMVGYEEQSLLSIGTLIHNYCQQHGTCDRDSLVAALISALENKMSKKCKVTPATKKVTLMALRGIGNAGYAMGAIPTLEACMQSPLTEIRLSAINAFRRMPCDANRKMLMNLFLDYEEDSEIRIAAYRGLMQCPTTYIISKVKTALEMEQVNQVGSYVWAHLTNLMETSDRHMQDIRAILEDETFKKEFDLDKRKFSRNYEGSFFLDALNTGAKLEGDLIWSSKSFIPRSSMVNLTIDLFGHSVNLLEIGGRVEGLENILETLFGPNGYFAPKASTSKNELVPKSIHPEKIKRINNRFGAKMDELRGSMYMRMFGNELKYSSFDGMESFLTASDINLEDIFNQMAKDNDYTYSHSSMFLDSSIIIPTGSGFPLNLTVNGTSTVDLRMKGKIDLRQAPNVVIDGTIQPSAALDISSMMSVDAFVTRPGIKMVSTLHSSTAVQGKVTVRGDGTVSAEYQMPQPKMEFISVKTSFFTIHANVEKEQTKMSDRTEATLCSPRKLVTVTGLELCAEISYPKALKADAPYIPFSGPMNAGVYLYRRDTHTKYELNIKSLHDKTKNILHFSMNTPNSRIDRHILGDITVDKSKNTFDIAVMSPWKKADIQGSYKSDKTGLALNGRMNVDGGKDYLLDAKLVKDRVKNARRYTTTLDITVPHNKPISLRGMFMHNGYRQFDIEYSMKGVTLNPVSAVVSINNRPTLQGIKASIELQKDRPYSFDASLTTQETKKKIVFMPFVSIRVPEAEVLSFGGSVTNMYGKKIAVKLTLDKVVPKKVTLNGFVSQLAKRRGRVIYRTVMKLISIPMDLNLDFKIDNRNFKVIATDFGFTYIIRKVARNNIKLVSKIQNLSSAQLKKGKATLNLDVKRNPELNMKMTGNINHNQKHTDMDIDIRYGTNFKDEKKQLSMAFELNRSFKTLTQASGDIMSRLRFPAMNLNMMMKGSHKHTQQNLDTNIEMRYGKNQPIQSSIRMWDRWDKQGKASGEIQLSYPGRNMALNHTIETTAPSVVVSTINVRTKKGMKNSIVTTIETPKEENWKVMSDVLLNGHTPLHLEGEFQLIPKDFITSLSMEKDSKRYSGSLKSKTISKFSSIEVDVEHPERRVVIYTEGKIVKDVWHGKSDIRWNADKDDSQRVQTIVWLEPPTPEKLNGSLTLSYPSRTLKLNGHHIQGKKYTTFANFQWDEGQSISTDTVISVVDGNVVAKGKLTTPFKPVQTLVIDLTHMDGSEEYKTSLDTTLNAKNTMSVDTILKKPLSIHTLVASIQSKNNFAKIKKMKLEIDHKLSKSLASSAKLTYNRQVIQASVTLQNTTRGPKVGVEGKLNLFTTFKFMKKASIEFSHNNNGKVVNTLAKLTRNKRAYSINSKVTQLVNNIKYENTGFVDISIPLETYKTSWSHILSTKNMATTFSTNWGKKNKNAIAMNFDALFNDNFESSLRLDTPFKPIGNMLMKTSFIQKENEANGKFSLTRNSQVIGNSELGYKMNDDLAKAGVSITIPYFDVDSSIQAHYDNKAITATMSAIITPDMTASLDIASGLVLWKSTFPGYEQIRYTYEIQDRQQLITTETLEYGNGKVIRLQTKLQIEPTEKRAFLELTTPFDSMTSLSASMNFLGNLESFNSNGFIEMLPVFKKISAVANYNTKSEISGKLRLDTPFQHYEYFQADFYGKQEPLKNDINVQIEYQPRKIAKFELVTENDLRQATLTTTVSVPSVSFTYNHKATVSSLDSEANLEIFGKKYGIDSSFKSMPDISSEITITSPNRRPIMIRITHKGQAMDFEVHAEVQHNRKNNFESDLVFQVKENININTKVNLKTQMISDEEYSIRASYLTSAKQCDIRSEFTSTNHGKSSLDISLGTDREITGSLTLASPLIKNIKASFSHYQSTSFLQSRADLIQAGKRLIDMDASLKIDKSVVAELTMQTPVTENIQSIVRFDGVRNNFALHAESSLGERKAEIEYISNIASQSIQQVVTVKATNITDISAELSLTTQPEYKGYAEFKYGWKKHRIDASFKNTKDLIGTVSIESPLVEPVSASISILGEVKNFQSLNELSIGNKKSELQLSFMCVDRLEGSLSLTSPYTHNIALSFKHTGDLSDMISQGKFALNRKEFEGVLAIRTKGTLSGSLTVTTPYSEWAVNRGAVTVRGGLSSFMCHADYSIGSYKSNMDLTYSSIGKYKGLLTITSHIIPEISAGFDHAGSVKNFVSHGEFKIGEKKTEANIDFSMVNNLVLNVDLAVPEFEPISAKLTHYGILSNFKSHAELTFEAEKYEGDMSFNTKDKIAGRMALNLGSAMSDLEITFELDNNPDLKYHAEVKFGDDQTVGDIYVSKRYNALISSLTLTSPYFDEIAYNLKHTKQSPQDFSTHVDMKHGMKNLNADYTMKWTRESLTSTLDFSSSETKDISVMINHKGPMKNFVTNADVKIGNEHSIGEASFSIGDSSIVSNVNVRSQILNLVMNLNHKGELPKFTTRGDISIDGSMSELDINVNVLDDTSITAAVTTPGFSFKANHKGSPMNFHSFVEVIQNAETFSARAILQTEPKIEASFIMTSPIAEYESYKLTYTQTGKSIRDFQGHLEVHTPSKSSVSDIEISKKGVNLEVSYPEIKAKYTQGLVTANKFVYAGELQVLGNEYSSEATIEHELSQYNVKYEVKTSLQGYNLLRLVGTWPERDQKKGIVKLELDVNNDHNEIMATYSTTPKLDGSLTIQSAKYPRVDIRADLDGELNNIKASTEVLVDGERKGRVQTEWDILNKQTASLNIETPFENFTTINTNIVFRLTDLSNIDTSATFILEGDKIIDAGVKYTHLAKIEADAHFDSIYLHPVTATASLEKHQGTYKASSQITHNGDNMLMINGDLTYPDDILNTAGSLMIKPSFIEQFAEFQVYPLEISVALKNTPKSFSSRFESTINRKSWVAEAAYDTDRFDKLANFKITVPARDPVIGSISFKNKFSKYIINADLELNAMTKYGYDMNLKTRNGLKGKIILKTPIEDMEKTTITFESEGDIPNFKSEASIAYSGKKLTASVDLSQTAAKTIGTVTLITPFEGLEKTEVSLFKEGSLSNLKAGGKVMYSTEVIEANMEHMMIGTTVKSKLIFISPFTNEITLSADHSGPIDDFTNNLQLILSPDNQFKSETAFKISANYLSFLTDLETTMTGETSQHIIHLQHEGNIRKFKCDAKLQSDKKVIQFNADFQLDPVIEGSVSLATPFQSAEELKASFSHSGSASTFLTTGEIQYAPKSKISSKLDVLIHDLTRMEISAEIKTPFQDYEESKVTYRHSGTSDNFHCEGTILFAAQEISSTFTGKVTPPNFSLNIRTPFEGYRNIDMKFNIAKNRFGYSGTNFEASWAPGKSIVMEVTFSNIHNKLETSGVLSTPFSAMKAASFELSHHEQQGILTQTLKASLNSKNLIDIETDFNLLTEHKHAKIITRAPLAMKYEIEGDFTVKCVDISATANWNTRVTGRLAKLECGYDVREENTAHFKLTGLGNLISYDGQFLSQQVKSELILDLPTVQGRYGFDMSRKGRDATAKLMLPGRSLSMSGNSRPGVTTGTFFWDADNDKTKKVEFRSMIVPTKDSVKAELTLQMPSLRKEIRLRSEAIVNRGRVIFDGKAELAYSGDERQKLEFSTSLEDVSVGRNTNYSFSLGVSHPYSTVGIKLASHIGKTQNQYSAGMGVEYLTARRQTKTFQVGGMVNKLRKTAKFELQSPVKSISISSGLKTEDEFQVTLTNIYDKRRPLSTVFTINPSKKSLELVTNYDLDNPGKEYHILARYVNSSAVEAKAFRVVNRIQETDLLLAARLNNSQLLHTRLHWNPDLLQDIQTYKEKKMREYRANTRAWLEQVDIAIIEEVVEKSELIWDTMEKELGPQTMALVQKELYPVIKSGAVVIQDILASTYRGYLNPLSTMLPTSQVMHKKQASQPIPIQENTFSFGKLFARQRQLGSESIQAVRQTVSLEIPSNPIINTLLSVINKEIELAAKELASVHFDWKTTVYDPENGEIQIEFHLPIPLKSLDSAPAFKVARIMRKLKQFVPAKPSVNTIIPDLSNGWLPPFTGVATISKGHHITTFDGYMYDLPVDCTLILARDFQDGNFTLALSNKKDTTLTLLSTQKSIEINIAGQVIVGGKPVTDLPLTMNGIIITKEDSDLIHINADNLFDITYDTSIDHITIKLNGWYYGKTGGLLGTFDNEPSNDLQTSFGKVNYNKARFAKTWDIGRSAC